MTYLRPFLVGLAGMATAWAVSLPSYAHLLGLRHRPGTVDPSGAYAGCLECDLTTANLSVLLLEDQRRRAAAAAVDSAD